MDTQTTTQAKRGPKPRNVDRDIQIQQLRQEGKTLQAIADQFDISRQRVCQIIKG